MKNKMMATMTVVQRLSALTKAVYYPLCKRIQLRRYSSAVARDILKLHERGLFQTVLPEMSTQNLANYLKTPEAAVYCGFDPTADSLHIGNLLAIIALLHCQRAGHQTLALIGGATALIGDPSGKSKDRDVLGAETIENNILGIAENLDRIFTNHALHIWKKDRELLDVKIVNNMKWYKDVNLVKFMSGIGRHFRMGSMLGKHSVQTRLNSSEGMSFTEFTYQIFQAYDFLYLLKNHNCHLQIGGNDQVGNITAGIDLVHKASKDRAYGLTIPLITSSTGHKVGKSEGNALWLDGNKTTPYELYQYFINLPDTEVEQYLKLFTFLSDAQLDMVIKAHNSRPDLRKAQKEVAEQVTLLVHGEAGLLEAQRWTEAFFSNDPSALTELSSEDLQKLFNNAPCTELIYQHDMTVLDLVMRSKSFDREVDAVRMIKAGAIYLNHRRIQEPDFLLTTGHHILSNDLTLLRVGKKKYHIIKWLSKL